MRSIYSSLLALVLFSPVHGQEEVLVGDGVEGKENIAVFMTRTDSLPDDVKYATDPYFEGYIQALVDMHYSEYRVVVIAKKREVWLANLPQNTLIANSIVEFVKDIPGVKEVHILDGVPPEDEELREKYVRRPQIKGVWFPQMTELFQPLVAD